MTETLTLEQIDALLSTTRTRGGYKPVIKQHIDSGLISFDLSAAFPGKKASAITQSVKLTIPKLAVELGDAMPELKCVPSEDKAKVYLINMTAYKAAQ